MTLPLSRPRSMRRLASLAIYDCQWPEPLTPYLRFEPELNAGQDGIEDNEFEFAVWSAIRGEIIRSCFEVHGG